MGAPAAGQGAARAGDEAFDGGAEATSRVAVADDGEAAVPAPRPSAWAPLRRPVYRSLWIAQLVSNIGTWMQNVGAVWLMGDLGGSAAQVAFVQTAITLPVFATALPAGALADIVDRRRLLLCTQTWMLASAATLGVLTAMDEMTPTLLLALTFSLGLGTAINMPAWQAIQPELVSREEFPEAVALGSASVNVGRAIGPALGGVLVAVSGSETVFVVNALSFLGIVIVLFFWRRPSATDKGWPAERLGSAIRAGLRYGTNSPALRAVLARSATFMVAGSAMMALLPVVARDELELDSAGYGLLLTAFGAGAVTATVVLPRLREKRGTDRLVIYATLGLAVTLVALGLIHSVVVAGFAVLFGGLAWLITMSSLNISAQGALPAWVRARGMGFYLLTVQGGVAIGSAIWGLLANHTSVEVAMVTASATLVLGTLVARRYKLTSGERAELTTSAPLPEPGLVVEPRPEQGPVLIIAEWRVPPENADAFEDAMVRVGRMRRRTGARRWGLFRVPGDTHCFRETFVFDSWEEHLRQRQRITANDRRVEDIARDLADGEPKLTHLVSAYS